MQVTNDRTPKFHTLLWRLQWRHNRAKDHSTLKQLKRSAPASANRGINKRCDCTSLQLREKSAKLLIAKIQVSIGCQLNAISCSRVDHSGDGRNAMRSISAFVYIISLNRLEKHKINCKISASERKRVCRVRHRDRIDLINFYFFFDSFLVFGYFCYFFIICLFQSFTKISHVCHATNRMAAH